jgi:hypothetical protein
MEKNCEEIFELLVDYTDGNLSPQESAEISEHLEKCAICQKNLKALEKSLKITRFIWEDALKENEPVDITVSKKASKFQWVKYSAVAATILLTLGIIAFLKPFNKTAEPELTLTEIKQQIDDEGNSARLLTAADIIAKNPETKEIAANQYNFIIKMYPKTESAKIAKSRFQ